jgi:hypothetical protein
VSKELPLSDPDFVPPAWPKRLLAGLLIWIVLCLALATRPLVDHVPTGLVDGKETSEPVRCHSTLSGSDDAAELLPELEPPRAYARQACQSIHSRTRLLLAIDLIVALAGASFLVRRIARDRPARRRGPTTRSTVSAART